MQAQLIIVGAGAAGLWAAGVAARRGVDVLLLEKTPRTGTKILASGGTRCNLTTTLGPAEAARLFRRRGERFLRAAFDALPPAELRTRFHALDVPTEVAPLEKIFPASGRARDVRDALEHDARAAGVRIELDAPVLGVQATSAGWECAVGGGGGERTARAPRVFLCPGGKSYPRTGTTGDGYTWLAALGLPLVVPVPALVPLASPADWVRDLTGLSWQDGEARLEDEAGRVLMRRRRPLLFTHRGLSGPAAMDVSVHVAQARLQNESKRFVLRLDLFPDVEREVLRRAFVEIGGERGAPRLTRALPLPVPRRMLDAVCASAELARPNPALNTLDKATRHRLVETLKGWPLPIDGTLDWDQAEVTAGGLDLRAVNPRSMEVNGHPGLSVFGELLDLDGPIGGLNFQAAFACAELAARAL